MTKRCCEYCVYAVPLKDVERELLVCTDRPGEAGSLSIVQPGDVCRRFRKRREKPFRLKPPRPPSDDVRYIPLTKGLFAIVDAADYERVSRYKWCATGSGCRAYACRSVNGKQLSMHRFLMNPSKGMVVDHIDGNRLNNRRSNLRVCTVQQNVWNSRPKGKSSRYKGVCRDKDKKKWVVYVRRDGHNWYMGRFDVEIEAARAYDRKAFELFGEYAWLNFPEEFGTSPARRRLYKGTAVEKSQESRAVRTGLNRVACCGFASGETSSSLRRRSHAQDGWHGQTHLPVGSIETAPSNEFGGATRRGHDAGRICMPGVAEAPGQGDTQAMGRHARDGEEGPKTCDEGGFHLDRRTPNRVE